MAVIGKLSAILSLNSAAFTAGLKKSQKSMQRFGKSVAGVSRMARRSLLALTGVVAGSIALFAKQEAAERSLAESMKAVGTWTHNAEKDLLKFASSLQKVTKFGDEALLEIMAIGVATGKMLPAQLKKATITAIGLTKMGVDLKAGMMLLGRAAAGGEVAWSRYGFALDKSLTVQEKLQIVMDKGQELFKAVVAESTTLSVRMIQLANASGDLAEEFGRVIAGADRGSDLIHALTGRIEVWTQKLNALTPQQQATWRAALVGTAVITALTASLTALSASLVIVSMATVKVVAGIKIIAAVASTAAGAITALLVSLNRLFRRGQAAGIAAGARGLSERLDEAIPKGLSTEELRRRKQSYVTAAEETLKLIEKPRSITERAMASAGSTIGDLFGGGAARRFGGGGATWNMAPGFETANIVTPPGGTPERGIQGAGQLEVLMKDVADSNRAIERALDGGAVGLAPG